MFVSKNWRSLRSPARFARSHSLRSLTSPTSANAKAVTRSAPVWSVPTGSRCARVARFARCGHGRDKSLFSASAYGRWATGSRIMRSLQAASARKRAPRSAPPPSSNKRGATREATRRGVITTQRGAEPLRMSVRSCAARAGLALASLALA